MVPFFGPPCKLTTGAVNEIAKSVGVRKKLNAIQYNDTILFCFISGSCQTAFPDSSLHRERQKRQPTTDFG